MPPSQALNEIRRLRRDRYGQVTRANRLSLTRGGVGVGVGVGAGKATLYPSSLAGDNNGSSNNNLRQRNQNKSSFIAQYTSSKKSGYSSESDSEKHESLTSSLMDSNYLEMKALGIIPSMKKRYSYSNKLDKAMNGEYVITNDDESKGRDEEYYYDDDEEEFCCIPGKDKSSAQKREYCRRRLRDFYIVFFIFMFVAAFVRHFAYGKDSIAVKSLKSHSTNFNLAKNGDDNTLISKVMGKLESLKDMTRPYNSTIETPFLLDIALTGSSVVKASLSKCHELVMACEIGLQQPDYDENVLETFASPRNGYNGVYVNVDTSTKSGLERAANLGLVSSRKADVIAIKSLYDGAYLFQTEEQYARMFAMFVHPIARSVGYYHYLKKATWDERYHSDVEKMTLRHFVSSKHSERNPMVRMLSQLPGTKTDPTRMLTLGDLEVAKKVVDSKCLVGLYRDVNGSLARFARYFGWKSGGSLRTDLHFKKKNSNSTRTTLEKKKDGSMEDVKSCRSELIKDGDFWLQMQSKSGEELHSNSTEYALLSEANFLDLELYAHIEKVYEVQGQKIFNVV